MDLLFPFRQRYKNTISYLKMQQIKDLLFRGHELWLLSGKTMTQFSFLVFGGQIDTGS